MSTQRRFPSATQHINAALNVRTKQLLRDHGFRKHNLHFGRTNDAGICHIVTFEVDRFHEPGPTATFTIEVSIADIEIHELICESPFPKSPATSFRIFRQYINEFGQFGEHGFWTVLSRDEKDTTAIGNDVAHAVESVVLPYLDSIPNRDSLVQALDSNQSCDEIAEIALRHLTGDHETAKRLLNDWSNHPMEEFREEALQEGIELARCLGMDAPRVI